MTNDEVLGNIAQNLDRLTGVVDSLAASVVAHDDQIEAHDKQIGALIAIAEKRDLQIEALVRASEQTRKATENLERQWQAYINTLPKQ